MTVVKTHFTNLSQAAQYRRRATWPTLSAHGAVNFSADFALMQGIFDRSPASPDWGLAKESWRTGLCLEGSVYMEKSTGRVLRCLGSRGDSANHGAALAWPLCFASSYFNLEFACDALCRR